MNLRRTIKWVAALAGLFVLLAISFVTGYILLGSFGLEKLERDLAISIGSPYIQIDGAVREVMQIENADASGNGYQSGLRKDDIIIDLVGLFEDKTQGSSSLELGIKHYLGNRQLVIRRGDQLQGFNIGTSS